MSDTSTKPTKRAPFIVIEGLDRSGKTTQIAALKSRLEKEGVKVESIKFPDRTTAIGQMIGAYLRSAAELDDRAIHLLFSANRWELASKVEKTLMDGTPIICDRYAFSGIAFSAAKIRPRPPSTTPSERTPSSPLQESTPMATPKSTSASEPHSEPEPLLSYTWCRAPDAGLPAPDLVLFFDVSPEIACARGGYGEERYEEEGMQRRVRGIFARIGKEVGSPWVVVDASRERDVVEKDVWAIVGPLIREGVAGPVGKLWQE